MDIQELVNVTEKHREETDIHNGYSTLWAIHGDTLTCLGESEQPADLLCFYEAVGLPLEAQALVLEGVSDDGLARLMATVRPDGCEFTVQTIFGDVETRQMADDDHEVVQRVRALLG